eukprot:CAMPEP_0116936946 /NCGR_PEP_ID=MMETSP0467-20121206/31197_1 /TAXON_ID=283647 /ORGANISM="Mesodinium pulex, Strain SPMC105" /LENGTH=186 /DNA_ID=CAMNT_0004618639 /DNA_START=1534 /DNA_END=2094 /DNA_ORIENTATION=+
MVGNNDDQINNGKNVDNVNMALADDAEFKNYNVEELNKRIQQDTLSSTLHFWTNIKKKFRYNRRDVFGIVCEVFFPLLFIILGILLGKLGLSLIKNLPAIHLDFPSVVNESFLGSTFPLPQKLLLRKNSQDNQFLDNDLAQSFEDKFNNLAPKHLSFDDVTETSGSSANQWLNNISTFDYDIFEKI